MAMCTREELLLWKWLSMRGSHPSQILMSLAILITLMISTSYLMMMTLRLERDVDDHWYDLSKALASFAKNNLQEV